MSLLPRAALRPARPMRTFLAGCLLAAAAAAPTSAYAAGPASLPGVALPAASTPTPSCQPWQTMTHVPVGPTPPAGSAKASVPNHAVCRNAPPTPMPEPRWDPDTVVGGSRLAASGIVVDEPPGVPVPPSVGDVAYVLADMDSGAILAAKSPHAWLRPASTLKTLTALTLLPLVPPTQVVTATDDDVRAEGTRVGLIAGNPYPAGVLFAAMLMVSANDAVYALTSAVGGYDRALELMNAKAAEVAA